MGYKDYRISIDGREKRITSEEDAATILRIFNKDTAEELTLKEVGDICAGKINFYIASYQRGYRWGKDEVRALLDDIYEVYEQGDKAPKYCLQPLVVKKRDDAEYTKKLGEPDEPGKVKETCKECYELLDGQQRLTTLWLILRALSDESCSEPMYSVCYELVRKVDENFIEEAERTIRAWFDQKFHQNEMAAKKRSYKETVLGELCFIWYEVKDEKSKESEQPSEEDGSSPRGQSEKLFRKINKGKIELTNAELFKAMLLNDENARTELIERNLRLVVYIAKRFENTGIDIEDLISVGTIGLIKAVNSFDNQKNIKLATYASRCIENEILMHLRKMVKVRSEVSFDEPLNVDWEGNVLLLSDILGTESDTIYKDVETATEKEMLKESFEKLPERERKILSLRSGLFGSEEKTQKEIADMLGISQSYISRLEKKIVSRLKKDISKLV